MKDFKFKNDAGIALRMRVENPALKQGNPILEFYDDRETNTDAKPLLRCELSSFHAHLEFHVILSRDEPILDIDAETISEIELHLYETGLINEMHTMFCVSGFIAGDQDKLKPENNPDLSSHVDQFTDAVEFAEFFGVRNSGKEIEKEIKDGHYDTPFTGTKENTRIFPAVVMNDGALRIYQEDPESGTELNTSRRLMSVLSYDDIFRPRESVPSP